MLQESSHHSTPYFPIPESAKSLYSDRWSDLPRNRWLRLLLQNSESAISMKWAITSLSRPASHMTSGHDFRLNSWALHNFTLHKVGTLLLANFPNRELTTSFISCHVPTLQPKARNFSQVLTRISPGEELPVADVLQKKEDTYHLECTSGFGEAKRRSSHNPKT